ncbi:hypothetical protein AKJ45_02100 [candidate division MSBL1 archaeon SCGC-AAA261F19]|uniref:Transcription regulator AsnC/Lrp ligand binding domain-containing protein n=1 Tax=candidate division MSBL1 archaeon SCGC-AAA261F19 TaxID=1698275 RepID=A0A133V9Z2_9EURY|nr:hypothetical protein AKJ45_02100 [candidate division MSBL1 archaeon SCGC-AAA261F19]
MVLGYILITADPGEMRKVREKIGKLNNIKDVEMVTGPYDLIVRAEAEEISTLTSYVVDKLRHTVGITDTTTCIVIE